MDAGWIPLTFESNNKARQHAEFNNRMVKEKNSKDTTTIVRRITDASSNKTIYKERIVKY